MKKITKALATAGLAVVLGAGSAFAEEAPNAGKVGLGYQGVFGGDILQGVSARGWVANDVAVEGNFFYGDVELENIGILGDDFNGSLYLGAAKIMYAPVVNSNSRFYVGLEGGFGAVDLEKNDKDVDTDGDVYVITPLIGAEHYFSEFPEVGFNWEVGYKMHSVSVGDDDDDDVDISLDGTFVTLGAHYYF